MLIPIHEIIFYCFTVLLISASTMVITAKNPVTAVLCLVVTFFAASVLWMLMQAEFLSLVLIFVYVGAVMTLFLFVVMMLKTESAEQPTRQFLPLLVGFVVFALIVGTAYYVLCGQHFVLSTMPPTHYDETYNNVATMGILLFTQYLLPFEIAAVLLLVGMIAAIALAFHGKKSGTKTQKITEQLKANKKDRLRMVDLK